MKHILYDTYCRSCQQDKAFRDANCFNFTTIKHYSDGEYIAHKGNLATQQLVLLEGEICVESVLDSAYLTTTIFVAPRLLGTAAIFSKEGRYRVNIKSRGECVVGVIPKTNMLEQMSRCPLFLENFITHISTILDSKFDHIAILTQKNLKAKLAYYILSNSHDGEYKLKKNISELANYLSVDRSSLSRAISSLVQDGVITQPNQGVGKILNSAEFKNILE